MCAIASFLSDADFGNPPFALARAGNTPLCIAEVRIAANGQKVQKLSNRGSAELAHPASKKGPTTKHRALVRKALKHA